MGFEPHNLLALACLEVQALPPSYLLPHYFMKLLNTYYKHIKSVDTVTLNFLVKPVAYTERIFCFVGKSSR